MATAIRRLNPDQALEAAGYVRVSRQVQAEGHSPQIQREAIKRLARQEGYILTDDMIKEDHERGSKITRKGYQQIIEAVRDGQIQAVIVPAPEHVAPARRAHQAHPHTGGRRHRRPTGSGRHAGAARVLVGLVDSARVVERRPESHPVWLRAEVRWIPDVETLLAAGLLHLAAPPAGPVVPTSAELRRERKRRYRERQRAARQAAQQETPT
jgi:hypothetical protein